jgi:mannitol/fructose-specific phosphotransferase system IIA component (Ntr-type)
VDTESAERSATGDDHASDEGPVVQSRSPMGTPSLRLSALLNQRRIRIFDWPTAKEDLLKTLVDCVAAEHHGLDARRALDELHAREAQGSTFLNEGIALPHARLAGLTDPEVAIALTRGGVSDVPTDRPIEIVFLLLTPATDAQEHLQLLGTAARLFRDSSLRRKLAKAVEPAEVLRLVADAERG